MIRRGRIAPRSAGSPVVRVLLAAALAVASASAPAADGDWEITPESEAALERGLAWLAAEQTPVGNWQCDDLGLVATGALAFLAAGHTPGMGRYGDNVERAIAYVVSKAKPSGLLNIADERRDMYNHGLATFMLGQAYGMTADPRLGSTLDRALKLIARTQGPGGGWSYVATPADGDLSLCVMQAKALRSAVDSGLGIPPEVIERAIACVRAHYSSTNGNQFAYGKDGRMATVAMAAAGVVCLQEFGQYDDWRIAKSMEPVHRAIAALKPVRNTSGKLPLDAYTLNYVAQALYQVGGAAWREHYPRLRDCVVAAQVVGPGKGGWWQAGAHVDGKPGQLYGTAVGVFVLAIPNRYLPILQEGRIDHLREQFTTSR